ncbi:MAG: hypothetical protein Q4F34_07620 [Prevotellaceae bacterium]|nr:hypothetical protein [Prevotellaceae bacterium]
MKATEKKQYASPACKVVALRTSRILAGSKETDVRVYDEEEIYTEEQY